MTRPTPKTFCLSIYKYKYMNPSITTTRFARRQANVAHVTPNIQQNGGISYILGDQIDIFIIRYSSFDKYDKYGHGIVILLVMEGPIHEQS